ncbi:hypothetical protein Tco_1265528 [Tanacetum coccineum]
MSKLLYTRFTKLIIDSLLSLNKSIPRRSDSKFHSSHDNHPITKILSTTNSEYKFGMEVSDAMISDAIKKKVRYKYYMAKKVESEKAKIIDEPEEQHISPIKSGRGKGFMCYGDQVANAPNKIMKDLVPRKTRSLTEEAVVVKGEGSSAAHNKYYSSSETNSDATLYSSTLDKSKENANETDDADESEMDLSDDNPDGDDDDDARFYESSTDAYITSVVHKQEGNPELTSYILGASKVPLGTHVDVLATKILMHEMFPDDNAHHTPSIPAKKIPYPTTYPQLSSLQAKAKKLMQKAKKNMRKFNFKKAVAQKFKEYDQKLEALTNFNIFKAFAKATQAKELWGRYGYLFEHLKARFLSRKYFDTLVDHLQEVMVESLPIMVDTHFKEKVKKQVPEQVRDQVPVYVTEGVILER